MLKLFALLLMLIFVLLAFIHVYWALGGKMGLSKVIPEIEGKPAFKLSAAITLLVAMVMFSLAGFVHLLANPHLAEVEWLPYMRYTAWLCAFVFLMRAVGDFKTVGLLKQERETTFARWDKQVYIPFCLICVMLFFELGRRLY